MFKDILSMKNTAFTKFHEEAGARMVPFAGYNMPLEYTGINDEHINVRTGIGVFDVSHMGEFWVTGPNRTMLLPLLTAKFSIHAFQTAREALSTTFWSTGSMPINTFL
jgi:glycine cleavage system aminomethyltransferase T